MINKEIFRKTEGRLYRHFNQLKEINKLNYMVQELEVQKEKIRIDIKEANITLDEESRSITYEERVQNSSSGQSYAEKELERQMTMLENEWKYIRRKLLKTKARIRELERQVSPLSYNVQMMCEESKRFIELKYSDKKSIEEIADILNLGRTTAYRKREELVEDVANWCNIIN